MSLYYNQPHNENYKIKLPEVVSIYSLDKNLLERF